MQNDLSIDINDVRILFDAAEFRSDRDVQI